MASLIASGSIARFLRASPVAVLVVLELWLGLELVLVRDQHGAVPLFLGFSTNVAFLLLAWRFHRPEARWTALVALGGTYVTAHAFILGVELLAALVFVVLLISHVELRILSERFVPFLGAATAPAGTRLHGALARALARLGIALVLSLSLPLLAADLAVTGVVPVTSIPVAFLLAVGLVAVVLLLALVPSMERRAG